MNNKLAVSVAAAGASYEYLHFIR